MLVRPSQKPLALAAFLALASLPAGAGEPYGVEGGGLKATPESSFPRPLGTVAGRAFLEADDGDTGREPWVSDGTVAGTFQLVDLCPGPCSSSPRLIATDGRRLYFGGFTGSGLAEVWTTDGTRAGTFVLSRSPLFPAGGTSSRSLAQLSGSLLYFLASEPAHGPEVWRTDGTVAGTFRISSIQPSSGQTEIGEFTAFDGRLVFVADDGRGPALWVADGTPAGTRMIFDPDPGSSFNLAPTNLVRAGRYVYFAATSGRLGRELWRTDGTAGGTVNVADLVRGASGLTRFNSRALGDRLLFLAEGPGLQAQLRITNGTAASTRLLTRFGEGVHFQFAFEVTGITLASTGVGGKLYLAVDDGVHGFEPWVTDGTQAGTHLVKDVCPGSCAGWQGYTGDVLDRGFFFRGTDGVRGREIWFSDGTEAGTHLTRDLCSGACSGSDSVNPTYRVGSSVLFVQDRQQSDSLLWRSDGSTRGTIALSALDSRSVTSTLRIVAAGAGAVFPGFSPAVGLELWRSDGTPAGTGLLADLNPHQAGAASSPASSLPAAGSEVWAGEP